MRIIDKEVSCLSMPVSSLRKGMLKKGPKTNPWKEEEESRVKQMFGHKGRRGNQEESIRLWEPSNEEEKLLGAA